MQVMTLQEYSESRNISYSLLYSLCRKKAIAAGKVGKRWLLNVEKVDAFFEAQLTQEQAPVLAVITKHTGRHIENVHNARMAEYKSKLKELRACMQ